MLAAGACSPPSCSHAVRGSVLPHMESCLSPRNSTGRGLILTESVVGCADKYLYRSAIFSQATIRLNYILEGLTSLSPSTLWSESLPFCGSSGFQELSLGNISRGSDLGCTWAWGVSLKVVHCLLFHRRLP